MTRMQIIYIRKKRLNEQSAIHERSEISGVGDLLHCGTIVRTGYNPTLNEASVVIEIVQKPLSFSTQITILFHYGPVVEIVDQIFHLATGLLPFDQSIASVITITETIFSGQIAVSAEIPGCRKPR